LRQAYDYWQNQPGNYRAPVKANRPYFRAEEFTKLLGGGHKARVAAQLVRRSPVSPRVTSAFPS